MIKVNLVDTDYSVTHGIMLFWGNGCNSYHPIYAESNQEAIDYAMSLYGKERYNGLLITQFVNNAHHRLYADGRYDDFYTSERYDNRLPDGIAEVLYDSLSSRKGVGAQTELVGSICGKDVTVSYTIGGNWLQITLPGNITVCSEMTKRIFNLISKGLKPEFNVSLIGYNYHIHVDFK